MKYIADNLRAEYERDKSKLPNDNELPIGYSIKFVAYTDVLRGYYLIADYFQSMKNDEQMLVGVKNVHLLCSAVARQHTSYMGTHKWKDSYHVAATLFYGLNKNHAFHDGNKRISLLMLLYLMQLNNRIVNSKVKVFEELSVRTAANELEKFSNYKSFAKEDDPEINFIADFIKRNTRKIDKKFYSITYREFDSKLREFNCRLDNPSSGYIDVIYHEKVKKLWGLKEKIEERRFQIGFATWSSQVGAKAVKEALKVCGLTTENGIDSQVFFKSNESISRLIFDFEGPLMRLKDR